jgi:hypothetical protein
MCLNTAHASSKVAIKSKWNQEDHLEVKKRGENVGWLCGSKQVVAGGCRQRFCQNSHQEW